LKKLERIDWEAPGAAAAIAARLRAGALIALPTDTVYGLSCCTTSEAALQRLDAAKGIAARRSFVALVDAIERIEPLVGPGQDARALAFLRAAWPAPLTAVVALATPVSWGAMHEGVPTAAFRIPAVAPLRAVLAATGVPVVSTSANPTGAAPLTDADAIEAAFGSGLDLLVTAPGTEARSEPRRPSTLADCRIWPPRLLRLGEYDLERAVAAWPNPAPTGER
jgi:L-threonylcarbamoyladenylate synthase